jgi:hypothetical protein
MRVLRSLILALSLLATTPAFAAGPKVIGTMSFVGRPGLEAIEVLGLNWTARNPIEPGGSGGSAGKIDLGEFKIVKRVDATSPALLQLTFGGTATPEVHVDVTVRRGVVASYALKTVIVSGAERRAAETGGGFLEVVTLSAVAIRETVTSAGGSVTSCYDIQQVGPCN